MKTMQWARKQTGFTIVELLIVIVVIAILAAITVVAYNGIQNRAYDSAVQSDITAFAKKVEALKVDSTTGAVPFPLTLAAGIRVTKNAYEVRNNLYYCTNGDRFAVGAISKSGKGYSYDTTNGQRRLYGRYWGALQHVDCLHFELAYYTPLEWALKNDIAVIEGGAQGEHKLARGFEPVQTHSAHWLAHPAFADAVERFLEQERTGIERYMVGLHSPFRPEVGD
jgi:prepilin-type N-terminal cleavage/methylation domain-containing protein